MMATNPTLAALRRAAKGLLYPSESDEPFKAFRWPAVKGELTAETIRKAGKHPDNSPVEEVPLDEFFGELTEDLEAEGEEGEADAERYRNFEKTLREQLEGFKVFRVGDRNVTIYIV